MCKLYIQRHARELGTITAQYIRCSLSVTVSFSDTVQTSTSNLRRRLQHDLLFLGNRPLDLEIWNWADKRIILVSFEPLLHPHLLTILPSTSLVLTLFVALFIRADSLTSPLLTPVRTNIRLYIITRAYTCKQTGKTACTALTRYDSKIQNQMAGYAKFRLCSLCMPSKFNSSGKTM